MIIKTWQKFAMACKIYTRDRNVCPGWPVYEVKCLEDGIERGRGAIPTSQNLWDGRVQNFKVAREEKRKNILQSTLSIVAFLDIVEVSNFLKILGPGYPWT